MYSSVQNIALLLFANSVIYIFVVIVYRLTLHPLAKYPGPFLAKITTWYDTYHCYKKDRHLDQLRCQQKYGTIYRYGPNYLIVNTVGGLKDIYVNAKTNNVRKGDQYTFLHDKGVASTHSTIDKDSHAFKRRVISHGFSESALRSLEPLMIETIDKWLAALGSDISPETKGWSAPKNMAAWANYVTFDVLGSLCFGKPFGLLDSEDSRDFPNLMLVRAQLLNIIGNSPINASYKWFVERTSFEQYLMPKTYATTQKVRAFAAGALRERLTKQADIEKAGGEGRKDFIHYLSQGRDPVTGEGYTQTELIAELRLLIVAGSDTSSVTMAAAFYYLMRNSKVLGRLQDELRSTFKDVTEIVTGTELGLCHYLHAVIEETLRMAPPVPSSLQREVTTGGMTVDDHFLPAGTNVGSAAFCLHYNGEYFTDPEEFRPERWLSEYTSAEEIAQAKSAFAPFSLGNRGCVGKTMAYNELSVALGRVFWMYDVRLAPGDKTGEGSNGLYEQTDIFVSGRNGPVVEFRRHEGE